MTKMLMIADDMTGALDSGVMLSARHINTLVQIDSDADIRSAFDHCDVIVVNTETRHLSAEEAYARVYRVAKQAVDLGIPYIYKKTDSALRGNIGAELHAVLCASNAKVLHFAPAFPQLGRTTVNGMQLIDGVPLDKSPFAQDPLNPSVSAYIPDIITSQCNVSVVLDEAAAGTAPYIRVYNTETVSELNDISRMLIGKENASVFAGCAAFIGEMAQYLPIAPSKEETVTVTQPLMVFCGSMHEQGRRQIEAAERKGVTRYSADVRSAIRNDFHSKDIGNSLICSMQNDLSERTPFVFNIIGEQDGELYPGERREISSKLPRAMAELISSVVETSDEGLPMIIGGDTLGAFLAHIGVKYVHPVAEIKPGVVLATYTINDVTKTFVAKAGSFGTDDLLVDIIHNLNLSIKEVV